MGRTEHFDLTTIASTGDDTFSSNGFKYTKADRDLIDLLLWNALNHHHVGGTLSLTTPTLAPELTLSTTGGTIQANLRVYYKYTLVDENGFESTPSPESSIDTPTQITTPGAPTLTTTTTGGNLTAGQYFYALSAYHDANTSETKAENPAFITIPTGTSTNKIRVTLPTLPTNADGFNIYRKSPGSTEYYYLTSVDMTVATPPTYYDDTGADEENCARVRPVSNTTMSTNSITIEFPGATPVVPEGYTWKIYRTFVLNNYNRSLLHHVIEETSPGVIDIDYVDIGNATSDGSPPTTLPTIDQPEPVDLTDADEVQGRLPLGLVTAFPFVVTFVFQGELEVTTGEIPWTCPFPSAVIVKANARLGVGSTPASSSVIVDVRKHNYNAATPTTYSIWSTNTLKPTIPAGQSYDVSAAPNVDSSLLEGDYLLCDILQTGGGATPTDENLVVEVLLLARFDITTSTFTTAGWD